MDRKVQCPECQHTFEPTEEATSVDHSSHDVRVSVQAERPRSARFTRRGLMLRLGVVAVVLLAASLVRYPVEWLTSQAFQPDRLETTSRDVASNRERKPTGPASASTTEDAAPTNPLARLEKSVVLLEAIGVAGDSSVGSGFVVDDSGLIATNFHVVAHATQAFASFRNGERFRVTGLAAVQPEQDLAIVRLDGAPLGVAAAPLANIGDPDPQQLAPVIALGHPNGVAFSPYDGKVSRVVRTSQLPRHSQRFLQQLLASDEDATWIQHTATLSDGNSGGPLLNRQGQVIGVNTWVDRQAQFSYALHIKHVQALMKRAGSKTIPLGAASKRDAWVTNWLQQLSAENLKQLYQQTAEFRFQPASTSDYRQLQKLAWAVTVANAPTSLTLDVQLQEQIESLEKETDRVVARLRKEKWDGPGQILLINEFASQSYRAPLAGVFVIATVDRVVEGDDGSSGALMRIAGTDAAFFTPLGDRLFSAQPGASILFLGVNYNGRTVRYGDNPLKLKSAPVIVAGALLELE